MQLFCYIPGVEIYFDDFFISGRNDQTLSKVIERARANNVKFNINKIQYRHLDVKFMGLSISKGSIKPNGKYLLVMRELPIPGDKKGVLRLLGVCKYLAKYIPNLSIVTSKLRDLTKVQRSETTSCHSGDASKDGVGCVLLQGEKPIAFASRSLSISEQKWGQIEKELLEIVVACAMFYFYDYG